MSTKVYYAYLFKENAEFKDVWEAQKWVNQLRKKFIEWAPKELARWDYNLKYDHFDRIKCLEEETKDPRKGGIWDLQLQTLIYCREVDGVNYIAIQFFPSNATARFLHDHVKLREFWYQDQVDNEEGDPEDYELRGRFWNEVFDKCWTPCNVGLACDIYDGTQWNTTCEIIQALEKIKPSPKESPKEIGNE